ncbi:DUF1491 family protein [Novosphingobium colocasiae]|uniref:DUF1491 family protein n=1 Tax=Novosphingobium colocasiae TaxID=1256513 RepID=A0A918PGN5_9SPHN|nr:DUF1491 family protein [Novosphingobium colocasiae]GGZ05177.1 hypothetical protein GCM10011614_20060 [Novosphingobium colocasiae]
MTGRLPAHLEVSGLIRRVSAAGGFAAVLRKGEPDAGTILIVLLENGRNARLFERIPQADGTRKWACTRQEDAENKQDFADYLNRRGDRDPDLWVVELDVAQGERLIGNGDDC